MRGESHEEAELMLVRKLFNVRELAAATRIQIWWKKIRSFKLTHLILSIRTVAASKIQKAFRRFKVKYLNPSLETKKRARAVSLIQNVCRGYQARRAIFSEISLLRMYNVFDHFDNMKLTLQTNSQVLIAYHWHRYLRLKQIREEERKKQAALDLKKKKTGSRKSTTQTNSFKSSTVGAKRISNVQKTVVPKTTARRADANVAGSGSAERDQGADTSNSNKMDSGLNVSIESKGGFSKTVGATPLLKNMAPGPASPSVRGGQSLTHESSNGSEVVMVG